MSKPGTPVSQPGTPMSFEEFRRVIAQELQVEESTVVPEASFVEDLFADSIRLVEMMLHMAEKGIGFPIEEAWGVRTVGDAYQLYCRHAGPKPQGESVP